MRWEDRRRSKKWKEKIEEEELKKVRRKDRRRRIDKKWGRKIEEEFVKNKEGRSKNLWKVKIVEKEFVKSEKGRS